MHTTDTTARTTGRKGPLQAAICAVLTHPTVVNATATWHAEAIILVTHRACCSAR